MFFSMSIDPLYFIKIAIIKQLMFYVILAVDTISFLFEVKIFVSPYKQRKYHVFQQYKVFVFLLQKRVSRYLLNTHRKVSKKVSILFF